MKFDLFLEECDLAEFHWKQSLPDFSFSYLRETFPEARKLMAEMYKKQSENARRDLMLADKVERECEDIIFRLSPKEDEAFWHMICDGLYINPLRQGRDKLLKRNAFYISALSGVRMKGGITEADILKAKEYPINELIEVKNKLAKCLWHNDRHPSMHYYTKGNRCHCFPCGKSFDSIDIGMKVYGLSFIETVKKLAR